MMYQCPVTECPLHNVSHVKVSYDGTENAEIVFVGEALGRFEVMKRRPFVGMAGQELRKGIREAGISSYIIGFTNTCACRPPNNRDPLKEEIEYCSKRLGELICRIRPKLIVCVGRIAAAAIIGRKVSLEFEHGKVFKSKYGISAMPIYHTSASFKKPIYLRNILRDLRTAREFIRGDVVVPTRVTHPDDDGNVSGDYYIDIDDPARLSAILNTIPPEAPIAIDTEYTSEGPYSIQFSAQAHTGYMIYTEYSACIDIFKSWLGSRRGWIAFHGADTDIGVLSRLGIDINYDLVWDTLDTARAFQDLPIALKKLGYYLFNIDSKSYKEMVRPYSNALSLDYLVRILESGESFPDPPKSVMMRKGEEVEVQLENIIKKIKRYVKRYHKGEIESLFQSWKRVPEEKGRHAVELVFGKMPFPDLRNVPPIPRVNYACRDADLTLRLLQYQINRAAQEGMTEALAIDRGCMKIVHDMQDWGFKINTTKLEYIGLKLISRCREIERNFKAISPKPDINIRSNDDVMWLLKREGEIPRTAPTTEASYLEKHKKPTSRLIPMVLEYRRFSKLYGTYAQPLAKQLDKNGRIHTTLTIGGTSTGRLACKNPNLMNIPVRTEIGKEIRKAFVHEDGFTLLGGDYSQIELRVMAHLSGDKNMIDAFKAGHDIHRSTASEIYGVPFDRVSDDQRRSAKSANFGIIYGITAEGLANDTGLSIDDAERLLQSLFRLYPGVRDAMDRFVAEARQNSSVRNMFGRLRYMPGINSAVRHISEKNERMALNTPIQGTAADIIKKAMHTLRFVYPVYNGNVRPLLQIHDELIFETRLDLVSVFSQTMKAIMESVVKLRVPLVVDTITARSYGDMK